jgi:hypothetical protein
MVRDEIHHPLGLSLIAMLIDAEIVHAEPLLEPVCLL